MKILKELEVKMNELLNNLEMPGGPALPVEFATSKQSLLVQPDYSGVLTASVGHHGCHGPHCEPPAHTPEPSTLIVALPLLACAVGLYVRRKPWAER